MNWQLFLLLLSACLGFVAALFFAFGTARLTNKTIFELSGTYWNFNEGAAKNLATQRADYFCGAVLISLSFALQFSGSVFVEMAQRSVTASLICGVGYVVLAGTVLSGTALLLRFLLVRQSYAFIAEQKAKEQESEPQQSD